MMTMLQKISIIRTLLYFQGSYYALTGIWPILHITSFMEITGPKEEIWLVKTVGMVVLVLGAGFLWEARRRGTAVSIRIQAALAAAGFIIIDIYYVLNNTISPIYLLDAGVQIVLLIFWTIVNFKLKQA